MALRAGEAGTLQVPDRANMQTVKDDVPVSTTINGEKVEDSVPVEFPKSLADAICLEGEQEVFRRYINAFVVAKQAGKRAEMAAAKGEKEPRKRAKYLEELNL